MFFWIIFFCIFHSHSIQKTIFHTHSTHFILKYAFLLPLIKRKLRRRWFEFVVNFQIWIGGITMNKTREKYFIKVQDDLIEVSREVYITYYKMVRREKYLVERDREYGLIYYDGWNFETCCIKDSKVKCGRSNKSHIIRHLVVCWEHINS